MNDNITSTVTVNGAGRTMTLPARTSLADALRDTLGLTGTRLGCEHGVCGACTVLVDDRPVRSCLTLAAACDGHEVRTVEGLSGPVAEALREAFRAEHGLQCGFCTAGMLITAYDVIERHGPAPRAELTAEDVRGELAGNLCRCTGYIGIVRAVVRAARSVGSDDLAATTSASMVGVRGE
ncbi:(2Fe-2S)-binding protein [Pseudonocardia acidicola]|uniref:(2Fe-2S)-binding protein n=1 Tax=Pseudonocardia acidicola TaxID=2724939 RepID=A0ABX1S8S9_9PSEU|nr:(2Fe-2S)-binding protein [Pseudonocardia acidicola]NMH96873.1 (2Fe-2S)-binding protein [Pseudonocardia acidicola]